MKKVKLSLISRNECQGVQINGTEHCRNISCKWQGLSACDGIDILKYGANSLGYKVTRKGVQSK